MNELEKAIYKCEVEIFNILARFEKEMKCCTDIIIIEHNTTGEIPQTSALRMEVSSALFGKDIMKFTYGKQNAYTGKVGRDEIEAHLDQKTGPGNGAEKRGKETQQGKRGK